MFEKYIATKEDLLTIEEGISYVYKPELDFIFKDKSKIDQTFVISFDSKEIFVWSKINNKWVLEKYPHNGTINDQIQKGWAAGYRRKLDDLAKFLPEKITSRHWLDQSSICGSLITPFIEIQKNSQRKNNPYTTKESYLATMIHEFGHIYFDEHKYTRSFYWDKNENLNYINTAINIENQDYSSLQNLMLRIASDNNLSELFAFCTDYSASQIFFQNHYKDIKKSLETSFLDLLKEEQNLDLTKQDSILKDPHNFASVFGPIVIKKYGNKWVEKLLEGEWL